MQFARYPGQNPFKRSTVFSRRITVIQGKVRLCDEFASGDLRASRFWIASSYEVIRELTFPNAAPLHQLHLMSTQKYRGSMALHLL
jgi:hypothetical protein